jgi:transposase-like protein/IS1 family transposase
VTCHNCRIECKKSGKRPDGLQRYRCAQCGKTFSDHKDFGIFGHKQVDEAMSLVALRMLCEGNSIRSTERITGLGKKAIMRLLIEAGEKCEALLAERIRDIPVTDVQADEIWCFVGKKQANRRGDEEKFPYLGDAWTFVAIERHTKLVLAFELGKRTVTSATRFMAKLADATAADQRFQLTTDGLKAYNYAVGTQLDERVDYAQLVKIYTQETPEAARRYSPPRMAEAIPTPVYGDPDGERICTSHVERQNLTMRMCIRH